MRRTGIRRVDVLDVSGTELERNESPILRASPIRGAMDERLAEDQHISSFQRRLVHQVRLCELRVRVNFVWPRVVALVRSRNHSQTAVARIHILQHEHDHRQIVVDSALVVLVMMFTLVALLATVQILQNFERRTFGVVAGCHRDACGVVQAEPFAHDVALQKQRHHAGSAADKTGARA